MKSLRERCIDVLCDVLVQKSAFLDVRYGMHSKVLAAVAADHSRADLLTQLDLHNFALTDDDIALIVKFSSLQSLDLSGNDRLTCRTLELLTNDSSPLLSSLQRLSLNRCSKMLLSTDSLRLLGRFRSLKHLEMNFCELKSDDMVEHIASLQSLCTLSITCNNIKDDLLKALSTLPNLEGLGKCE
jgi:hypothetical protein